MGIGRKFTFAIVALLVVIGVLATGGYYIVEEREQRKEVCELAAVVGYVLEESLGAHMLTGNTSTLRQSFEDIRSYELLKDIHLLDNSGTLKLSTASLSSRDLPEFEKGLCSGCHELKGEGALPLSVGHEGVESSQCSASGNVRGIGGQVEKNVYRWLQPLSNDEPCHRCHDPQHPINGALVLDFSLETANRKLAADLYRGVGFLLGSLFIIGGFIIYVSNSIMLSRLEKIAGVLSRFKKGDYSQRLDARGSDEIADLEEHFNEMAETIERRDEEKDELLKQLSVAEKEWQTTFDNITDLISIHDPDYRIIRANKAFLEAYGDMGIFEHRCYEVIHGIECPVHNCPHKQTIESMKPVTEEVRDPRTNKILRVSTYPYHDQSGRFMGSVHIVRDITEEKENEMRLIMSDKLASLGQMAAGIAHEINNPLASIAGCTEGLQNRVEKDKFNPELFSNYLSIIEDEVRRCKNITTNMLSFVRVTSSRDSVYLNETIDRTLEIIGFQGRLDSVEIIKNYMEKLPIVYVNEGEIRQILMSIITNALDAMQDSGTLTIVTGVDDRNVYASITDSGPGIPPEIQDRIFDPFFTTKSNVMGTGLGLSIAYKLVLKQSGSLSVRSSSGGEGTTFTVSLPL